MEKKETEAFRKFVENKHGEVSDFLSLLEKCANKVEFLEDHFLFMSDENEFNGRTIAGLAGILADERRDLRLLVADMMADVDRDVAEFKKRRTEEKKVAESPPVDA